MDDSMRVALRQALSTIRKKRRGAIKEDRKVLQKAYGVKKGVKRGNVGKRSKRSKSPAPTIDGGQQEAGRPAGAP